MVLLGLKVKVNKTNKNI